MANADEILVKFKVDKSDLEKQLNDADDAEVKVKPVIDTKSIDSATNKAANGFDKLGQKLGKALNSKSIKETTRAFADMDKAVKPLAVNTEKVGKSVTSMKARLRELKQELQQLEVGSDRFNQLAREAGELEDTIGDVNQQVRALASDTAQLDALLEGVQGVAGGFAAAQGAVALFGDENEELEKTMLKVQAAMAILQGVQAVANTLNQSSAFSTILLSRAQQAAATSTTFLGRAFGTLTKALLTNPLTATIVGITAAVIAIKAFTSGNKLAEESQKRVNGTLAAAREQYQLYGNAISAAQQKIKERYDLEARLAQAQGKDTRSINDKSLAEQRTFVEKNVSIARKGLEEQNKIVQDRKDEVQRIEEELSNTFNTAARTRLEIERTAAQESLDIARGKAQEITSLLQKGNDEASRLQSEQQISAEEAEQEAIEKAKEAAEKAKEAREKRIEADLKAIEQAEKQKQLELIKGAKSQEEIDRGSIAITEEFLKKKIELLKTYGESTVDLETELAQLEFDRIEQRKKEAQELSDILVQIKREEEEKKAEIEREALAEANARSQEITQQKIEEARRNIELQLEAEREIGEGRLTIAKDFGDLLGVLGEQSSEVAKAALVFEKLTAIADVIIRGVQERALIAATYAAFPPLQAALLTQSRIRTAINVATIAATAIPQFQKAAEGEEYVTGGRPNKDSVPFMLMPGERVVTKRTNSDYWDELHAMHTGTFKQLMHEKYILPALRAAIMGTKDGGNEQLASAIASTTMKPWNGDNLMGAMNRSSKQSRKQHEELIRTIKPRRVNKRKY